MAKSVFILSTGRSGTTSLADLLSMVPGAVIVHEARPKLLAEAQRFRKGEISKEVLVCLLRSSRNADLFGATSIWGESNQRLSFVLPALAEAFPNARYILLHRDGREVVDSLHHRLWYQPGEEYLRHPDLVDWVATRFVGADFGMPKDRWDSMTPFAKCSWYWALVPKLVRADAKALGINLLELRLEDLDQSRSELEKFLDLPLGSLPVAPKSNPTKSRRRSWRAWSPRMRHDFENYSGAEMDIVYPEWRLEFKWDAVDELICQVHRPLEVLRLTKLWVCAWRRGQVEAASGKEKSK